MIYVNRRYAPLPTEDDAEDDMEVNIIDRSKFDTIIRALALKDYTGEERWPGQYIDMTTARRGNHEQIRWPRPQ